MAHVGAADKAKTIHFCTPFRRDEDIFPRKLPPIWHIAFGAYMAFVPIIKVYQPQFRQFLKLCQAFYLEPIKLGVGLSLAPAPDSLVFSAKAFKKRRKTSRLTVRPIWAASHSAFAMSTRCRLVLMASRMLARSFSLSKRGLRPRPFLVCRPSIPSDLKRRTQASTDMLLILTIKPTSLEVRPSDLSRITWQRLRNAWVLPFLCPFSRTVRSSALNFGVFTRLIRQNDNLSSSLKLV